MSRLLIGTDQGVIRLLPGGGELRLEEGPPSVGWMAQGASRAYVVTNEGALWQEGDDDRWGMVNQRPVENEIWSFGADPRIEGRLYLGVGPAMLHISDDGGSTWRDCPSLRDVPGYDKWTFPVPPHIPHVRTITPDPAAAGAVYVGVEVGGLFRTADSGKTWESLNEGLYWDVHVIEAEPGSSNLYATTGRGFHRSDDGGQHWQLVEEGLDRSYTHPLAIAPNRKGLLFTAAATTSPPGWQPSAHAAIYRSEDSGKSWAQLTGGLPAEFDEMVRPLATDDSGAVFAAAGSQLYASRDEGASWELLVKDLPTVRAMIA